MSNSRFIACAAAWSVFVMLSAWRNPEGATAAVLPKEWRPVGWTAGGPGPFDINIDRSIVHSGLSSLHMIRTSIPSTPGGGIMSVSQTLNAIPYRGKRVRIGAWVKTHLLAETPYSRVYLDVPTAGSPSNMGATGRAEGDSDWRRVEWAEDVPSTALAIYPRITIVGPMEAWIDNVRLDVVPSETTRAMPKYGMIPQYPFTAQEREEFAHLPTEMVNTGFEEIEFRTAYGPRAADPPPDTDSIRDFANNCGGAGRPGDRLICYDIVAGRLTKALVADDTLMDTSAVARCSAVSSETARLSCYSQQAAKVRSGLPVSQRMPQVGVTYPTLVHDESPAYPDDLRQSGHPGSAEVRFDIDTLGHVLLRDFAVLTATNSTFADAVWRAAPAFRYTPARVMGRAVASTVRRTFEWSGVQTRTPSAISSAAGAWAVSGPPWTTGIMELHVDTGRVDGLIDQGRSSFPNPFRIVAPPPVPLSGRVTGNRVELEVGPVEAPIARMTGTIDGDSIVFTQAAGPGQNTYLLSGTFVARRATQPPPTSTRPKPATQAHSGPVGELPTSLSDSAWWALSEMLSEPGGAFQSDNFVSNERAIPVTVGAMRDAGLSGGVYIGVGPEQNFSYIAAMHPRMAFIVDIRRQAIVQHLMYKALFDISTDRVDFMSKLFAMPRPASVDASSSLKEIWDAFGAEARDSTLYANTREAMRADLERGHGFPLSAEDRASLQLVYAAFATIGPSITYGGYENVPRHSGEPSFAEVSLGALEDGAPTSFLGSEAAFQSIKEMQSKNLIVLATGDFAGPKTLRGIGGYVRDHGATVSAFYVSNVEQYLFKPNDTWNAFYRNVATFPIDSASAFLRTSLGGGYDTAPLCPMAAFLAAYAAGRVTVYQDAQLCRQ